MAAPEPLWQATPTTSDPADRNGRPALVARPFHVKATQGKALFAFESAGRFVPPHPWTARVKTLPLWGR